MARAAGKLRQRGALSSLVRLVNETSLSPQEWGLSTVAVSPKRGTSAVFVGLNVHRGLAVCQTCRSQNRRGAQRCRVSFSLRPKLLEAFPLHGQPWWFPSHSAVKSSSTGQAPRPSLLLQLGGLPAQPSGQPLTTPPRQVQLEAPSPLRMPRRGS